MGTGRANAISKWIPVERTDSGWTIRALPGAQYFPLAEVIAHVLGLGIAGVDFDAVTQAWQRADGVPVEIVHGLPQAAPVPATQTAQHFVVACADMPLRDSVAGTLTRCGISFHSVESPDSAWTEILEGNPDLVLLSHPLGCEDALEVCRQVRSHPRIQKTPNIMISSVATREVVIDAIRAGASDMMVRPVAPQTLLRKVSKALEGIGKTLPARGQQVAETELRPVLAAEEEVKSLGRIDIAKLTRKVDRLMALPAVVQRVLSITSSERTGAHDLATAVASDPAVSAIVLRRANSVTYGKSDRSFNVQESIVRLGFSLTRSLVVGMSVIRMFPKGQKTVGFNRVDFWRHSLATAILARLLASRSTGAAPDVAFMAGLLHDIGKLILDEYCTHEFEQAGMIALREFVPMREAERRVFEADHAQVGGAILETWRFPQPIVGAVAFHHSYAERKDALDAETLRLCRIVHAANVLAKAIGEGHGGDLLLAEVPRETWVDLGFGAGLPKGLLETFDQEIARSEGFLELESEIERSSGTADRVALFCDETQPVVSVLALAVERLGYRPIPLVAMEQASRVPAGTVHAGVVRAATTERLAAILDAWRVLPGLSGVPLVGVLPAGQPLSAERPGISCFAEPIDRLALQIALG